MAAESVIFVYITVSSPEEADRIGRSLVEERLAACVNRFDGMTSTYRWQGALETARETVLIAKTRAALFEPLAERVRALHSYATPCIAAWPLVAGNPAYLDWVVAETTC